MSKKLFFLLSLCISFSALAEEKPVVPTPITPLSPKEEIRKKPSENPPENTPAKVVAVSPEAQRKQATDQKSPAGEYTVGEEMEDITPPEDDTASKDEEEDEEDSEKKDQKTEDEDTPAEDRWLAKKAGTIQVLDKTKSRSVTVKSQIGKEYSVGSLVYTVKKCFTANEAAAPDNSALVEISEKQNDKTSKKLFYGWMFSSKPALTYIENPVYDVVLSNCVD